MTMDPQSVADLAAALAELTANEPVRCVMALGENIDTPDAPRER
jgi:hypothetical protein